MNKQEFIDLILPGAKKAYKDYGILPSLTLAQAVLESGWGGNSPGNMLFGIKWQDGCGYNSQLLWTTEYIDGQYLRVQDNFRAYESMADSVYDHALFLVNNSRYAPVLQAQNYLEACTLIQQCGYATDPSYTDKLIGIIEYYNFQLYDRIAKFEKSVELLHDKEVIGDKSYWLESIIPDMAINPEYMKTIIKRFVAMYVILDTYEQVVDKMVEFHIIGDPGYWTKDIDADGYVNPIYAEIVINRMADFYFERLKW